MTLSNPAQYISGRTVQEQMNSLIDYVDQRAAEVATDAIASDVAQVHSDAADAHTDALAAAASASAAAGTLANAVKKTGEASQSIAGDIAVAGALSGGSVSSSGNVDGASIGSGVTPVVCGDLTAYGNVSLDDTALQGNLSVADPSALINLGGAGSVIVPTPTSNNEAANKKYVDDALDAYAPMVRTTGNQTIAGVKNNQTTGEQYINIGGSTDRWVRIGYSETSDFSIYGVVLPDKQISQSMAMEFWLQARTNSATFKYRNTLSTLDPTIYAITYDGTTYELWYHYNENTTNRRMTVKIVVGNNGRPFIVDGTTTEATLDPNDYVYFTNPSLIS